MQAYQPPFQITAEILSLTASIAEKVGMVQFSGQLRTRPHLRRNNRIRSIYSSLKIEANSLSLGQVRDVLGGRLVLGEQREIQEVKNAYASYEQLSTLNPYEPEHLKRLHGIMTKYLVEESGVFRRGEEGVFQGDTCIFMAPPARLVPSLMQQLFDWMNMQRGHLHPLILSAVFHYEFVFIHPFSDGNGRMARLWHTAILSQWKPVFAYIPLESQIEAFQEDYYAAISACHAAGESTRFVAFMLQRIDAILDEVAGQLQEEDSPTDPVARLLSVMEYDIPYSGKRLMELLGLKSRESFRQHYLQPALAQGYIQRTVPDKPNSRQQRYVRMTRH